MDELYSTMERYAGLDKGFELWRRLFFEKKGGSEITYEAGLTRFMEQGACKGWDHINDWLDNWEDLDM